MEEEKKMIYHESKEAWRKWLEKNHLKESKTAVIRYKKHTGKPSPTHLELMHEAICFGWIDTTVKRIDDEKYMINFSKRNNKSKWSNNTLSYGKKMIEEGKMSPEGLKYYNEGLQRETLDHGIPLNPEIPKDLKKALEKGKAWENFKAFAPSYRRTYLRWLIKAKLPETRKKRIDEIVSRAQQKRNKWL